MLNVCVWGGGGVEGGRVLFYGVFVMLFFSNSELNTKSFSFGKNIFIDNIYNANIFQVAC